MASTRPHRSSPLLIVLSCCLLLALPAPSRAVTMEGVTFADSVDIEGNAVPLRSVALLRYLRFIKVYVAALYLPPEVKATEVLADVPKRLEIAYLVAIGRSDFVKAATTVLEGNLTPAERTELQERLDALHAAYRDVQPGDRYALTYSPGRGTELALNGTPLITVAGADFAHAYFGIWLGRNPIDAQLRRDLLRFP